MARQENISTGRISQLFVDTNMQMRYGTAIGGYLYTDEYGFVRAMALAPGGTDLGWQGEVTTYADLPAAAAHNGELYLVNTSTWLSFPPHLAGLYRSNGVSWSKIKPYSDVFADNVAIWHDDIDNTKKARLELTDITPGETRVMTVPDKDIIIADNADVTNKLPIAGGTMTGGLILNSSNPQIQFPDTSTGTTGTDKGKLYYYDDGLYFIKTDIPSVIGRILDTNDIGVDVASQIEVDGKKEYHGIEALGALTFDNSTHVFTIASGTNTYWYKGVKYTTSSAITVDLDDATLEDNKLFYIYFDDASGTLKVSKTAWNFYENVFVATVFWNGSAGAIQIEKHGYNRNLDWHVWAHDTIGTRYESGLTKTYPTVAVPASLQIETGNIHDEDLDHATGQCTTMRGWYKVSANVYTYADYSLPYVGTSGQPQYLDTDTYTLTNVAASDFVNMWVYASLDTSRPIYIIPTHAATAFNTVGQARAATVPETLNLNLNSEMKLIYKFIYKGDGSFVESVDYRSSSPVPGGGTPTVTAGSVSYVPGGNISSTDVQNAITELDSEKVAKAGDTMTGRLILHNTNSAGGQLNFPTISPTSENLGDVYFNGTRLYLQNAIGFSADQILCVSDIIDNLTSTSEFNALSAKQGKALQDGKEAAFSKNTAFNKNFGTGSSDVCVGNDARLSDARTPTSHNHSASEITSGTLPTARGGTNQTSWTANRLAYANSTTQLSALAEITANRALISNANGLPTHSATTDTELGYLSGVTSNVQTQLDSKGAGLWKTVAGTPVRVGNTSFTVTGDYTAVLARKTILKWTDTTTHCAMIVSSSYSSPNTTVNIIGDELSATATMNTMSYAMHEATVINFAVAGTIGAVASDVANTYFADEPYRVLGADMLLGTAGTTNSTTIDINKNGTTMFTTKPSCASTVATSLGNTANDDVSLALSDKVTIDIDAVQTTKAVDLYVKLFLFPTKFLSLT